MGWACHEHGPFGGFPRCPKCASEETSKLRAELRKSEERVKQLEEMLKMVLDRSEEKEILQKAKYFGVDEEHTAGALWLSRRIRAFLKKWENEK